MKYLAIIIIFILVSCVGEKSSQGTAIQRVDSIQKNWFKPYLDTVQVKDTVVEKDTVIDTTAEAPPVDNDSLINTYIKEYNDRMIVQKTYHSTKYEKYPYRIVTFVTEKKSIKAIVYDECYSSECKLVYVKQKYINEAKKYINTHE